MNSIRAKGYEIGGDSLEEGAAKYNTFRPLDKDRPVRGSVKSLGREYTKERINERIRELVEKRSKSNVLIPKNNYSRKRSLTPPIKAAIRSFGS